MHKASGIARMSLSLKAIAFAATLLLLGGCQQELYSNLSEVDANQMLATLTANGISVEKISKGKDGFTIAVDSRDMLRSIALLKDTGYPKSAHTSLERMFENRGIMPSPFEERVRYIYALGEEVAKTLSQIDGVIAARVHIVLPENPELGQPIKPSSAAVFIKHQPGVDLDFFQPQIRRLVSSAIEGLQYDAVTVVLSEATPTKTSVGAAVDQQKTIEILPGLNIADGNQGRFWGTAIVISLVSVGLSLLSAFSITSLLKTGRISWLSRRSSERKTPNMMVEPS
jgi:type III secretion protein J